jgi:hypothetical protein
MRKTAATMGININDSQQSFTGQILRCEKSVETRSTRSLDAYIGRVVGIVRTGVGPATLVGYATLGAPILYPSAAAFDADASKHLVSVGNTHHISASSTGVKWGYPVSNVTSLKKPVRINTRGIVSRRITIATV